MIMLTCLPITPMHATEGTLPVILQVRLGCYLISNQVSFLSPSRYVNYQRRKATLIDTFADEFRWC